MKVRNLNASSAKTKQLIRDTFAELLHEKHSIEKVSVTELVKRAEINRSTFYAHYDGIWQVADDIKSETMKVFFNSTAADGPEQIGRFFDEIYQYLKKNDEFFRLIFISDEVTGFVRSLGEMSRERIYSALSSDLQAADRGLLELEVSTFCDGFAMQIIRYYQGSLDSTLENLIDFGAKWCRDVVKRRKQASQPCAE